MKDDDRRKIYAEFDKPPRQTLYKVEVFIETDTGIKPFDAFKTRDPPQIPDEGETYAANWIENKHGQEMHHAVSPEEISSDGKFTSNTSLDLPVINKSTTYKKRTFTDDSDQPNRLLIIHHSITLETHQ